jgi:hypothetical protein
MNYRVISFYKGGVRMRSKVDASNSLQAAKLAEKSSDFTHILVIGSKATRYIGSKLKPFKEAPMIYRAYFKAKIPSVLLMFGTAPEFYGFKNEKERDVKYEEMKQCITSMSAGSAKAGAELTAIIVSLDEISGSKSTSTSKKTLSGSAMSATCRDTLILPSIDRLSGMLKSEDTDTNTCSSGSSRYRSKQDKTFFATLHLKGNDYFGFPGINTAMAKMDGHTMQFTYNSESAGKKLYKSGAWFWVEEWFDKEVVYAKLTKWDFIPQGAGPDDVGKIFKFTPCHCGCGQYYTKKGQYAKPEWLEPSSKNEYRNQKNGLTEEEMKIAALPQTSLTSRQIEKQYRKVKKMMVKDKKIYRSMPNDKQNLEVGRTNGS